MQVYVTRTIPDSYIERIRDIADVDVWEGDSPVPRTELLARVAGIDGLFSMLTDRIDADLLDAAPQLQVVSQMSVGVDNIDVDACRERGVRVGHTPDVLTGTVADHAFALLLAVARRLPEGADEVRSGRWGTWDPWHLLGADVHETTLGVVGMGRVGRAVADRASGFGMDIVYASPRDSGSEGRHVDFDDLLRLSDHVVITVPLNSQTRGMFDARAFGLMKPTATLVNVARGPIVDSTALVNALETREIFGAGLDVTDPEPLPADHPLVALPNCLVVPHIASASTRTRHRMAERTVDNLIAALTGAEMPSQLV
ncbi:MAG: D-glycerate dehydrogenase [Acidimicrobiia bacterium]